MEQLFDLDKLHKRQRQSTIKRGLITSIALVLVIAGSVAALSHKKSTNHLATVSGDFTAQTSSNNSSSMVAVPSTSTSSNLTQQEAEDKTLAAQDEAAAERAIANTQSAQAALNNEAPPSTIPTNSTSNIPTPNPALCSQIKSEEQAATASLSSQSQQISANLSELQSAQQGDISGGNYSAAEQLDAGITNDTNQLNTNARQISSIDAQYAPQLAANECS